MSKQGDLTNRDLWERWGRSLRAERLAQDLSQMELAEASGVSQTVISSMERGLSGGRDLTRIALAGTLGREVIELFPYPTSVKAAS